MKTGCVTINVKIFILLALLLLGCVTANKFTDKTYLLKFAEESYYADLYGVVETDERNDSLFVTINNSSYLSTVSFKKSEFTDSEYVFLKKHTKQKKSKLGIRAPD